jgi:cyclophilin family peptidyl-prolyl cis-trans isomerase
VSKKGKKKRQTAQHRQRTPEPVSRGSQPPKRVASQPSLTDRLRQNRLAVVGLVVTVLIAIVAAAYLVSRGGFGPSPEMIATPGLLSSAATLAQSSSTTTPVSRRYSGPPSMTINPSKQYTALINTDVGDIKLKLFADQTPKTVNNFVSLARDGFYNGLTFHRVIEGFMAQGGDPNGTGTGGPGYQFEDEIVSDLKFDQPGLLAMANAGANTNGSQFFITFAPTQWLDGKHTIFGEVIEGADVLPKIVRRDPQAPNAPTPTKIVSISIEEN